MREWGAYVSCSWAPAEEECAGGLDNKSGPYGWRSVVLLMMRSKLVLGPSGQSMKMGYNNQ